MIPFETTISHMTKNRGLPTYEWLKPNIEDFSLCHLPCVHQSARPWNL